MPEQIISPDFRIGVVASIKNNAILPVYLISFYAERLERSANFDEVSTPGAAPGGTLLHQEIP
jgi:hypothetical protein